MASSLFGNGNGNRTQFQSSHQDAAPTNGFQPPNNLGQIKGILNMMRTGGNISGMVQTLLQNSPQGNEIMQYLNKNGGNAKAAFYDMAQQKGIDPNTIFDIMK